MSTYCIGSCAKCGGDVMAWQGPWMSILPPPPPTCSRCNAVAKGYGKQVIPMDDPIPSGCNPPILSPSINPIDRISGVTWKVTSP